MPAVDRLPTVRIFVFSARYAEDPTACDPDRHPELEEGYQKRFEVLDGKASCPIDHAPFKIGSICAIVSCCKKVLLAKNLQRAFTITKNNLCPMCRDPSKPLNTNDLLTYEGKTQKTIRELQKEIADKKALKQNLQTQLDDLRNQINERDITSNLFLIDPDDDAKNEAEELKHLISDTKTSLTQLDTSLQHTLESTIDELTQAIDSLENQLALVIPLENAIQDRQNSIARKTLLIKILKISLLACSIIGLVSYAVYKNKEDCFLN